VLYIQQLLWSEAKIELAEIRDSGISFNKARFAKEWKKFQYGDSLVINDTTGKYSYAVIDVTKQIIKKLAIIQTANNWLVKVAKEDVSGNNILLSAGELTAFKTYVDDTQPPGPKVQVISLNGDQLDARFNVYYDPLKDLTALRALVEAAYLAYIKTIDINGESVYYINRHENAIKGVEGIDDAQIATCQARPFGDAYTAVGRIYSPLSGYLVKDPALALTTALTFIPKL
jgi:hypothetical protein